MDTEVLKHVSVINPTIKLLLDGWKDYVTTNLDKINSELLTQRVAGQVSDGVESIEKYMSDEYRMSVVNQGTSHCGFPDAGYYIQMKPDQLNWIGNDHQFQREYINTYTAFNNSMIQELGIRKNALCIAYPPRGFIGWHNNANASSYNLIFTYSETGDGYWQHINPHTNEVETIPDVPGWQCKAAYFGSYSEHDPKTLIYHTAKTNSCWRLTVSYVFDRVNKEWWEQAIEEIESD